MDEIKVENYPKTFEELFIKQFVELQKSHAEVAGMWLKEQWKQKELQTIVDKLKKHMTLENGTVWMHIGAMNAEDRDFIVKAFELKEKTEEKENE